MSYLRDVFTKFRVVRFKENEFSKYGLIDLFYNFQFLILQLFCLYLITHYLKVSVFSRKICFAYFTTNISR